MADEFGDSTLLPQLPPPTLGNTLDVLSRVKEVLEVWQGSRGDGLDRVLTVRDLLRTGALNEEQANDVFTLSGQPTPIALPPRPVDSAIPPTPENLTATGAVGTIILNWDFPIEYTRLAHFEVWRADVDALGSATLIAQPFPSIYADDVGMDAQFYYWVRAVSDGGVSPFNAVAGVPGQTPPAFEDLTAGTNNGEAYVAGTYLKDVLIKNGAVTSLKVADAAIVEAKIGDLAVSTAKIADAAITTAKILDAAITTAKIGDAQITNQLIVDGAITANKIQANTITTDRLVANAATVAAASFETTQTWTVSGGTLSSAANTAILTTPTIVSLTTTGAPVKVIAAVSVHVISNPAAFVFVGMGLSVDGSGVGTGNQANITGDSASSITDSKGTLTIVYRGTLAAGAHNFALGFNIQPSNSSNGPVTFGASGQVAVTISMLVEENKV